MELSTPGVGQVLNTPCSVEWCPRGKWTIILGTHQDMTVLRVLHYRINYLSLHEGIT